MSFFFSFDSRAELEKLTLEMRLKSPKLEQKGCIIKRPTRAKRRGLSSDQDFKVSVRRRRKIRNLSFEGIKHAGAGSAI